METVKVNLLVAEQGIRNDVRDGKHVVSVVFSTDWLGAEQAGKLMAILEHGLVSAELAAVELPELPPEKGVKQ
jgi:hypothetical protein